MMDLQRFKPSPAMGIALLSLAIALSGTAYAANKIGTNQLKSNAVTTPKIKNNAVTTAKIKNNAVTTPKIKGSAVTVGKIANGAVTTDKIADSAVSTAKIANDAVDSSKISDYGLLGSGVRIVATDGLTLDAARTAAPQTILFQKGPLTVYAKCFRDSALNQLQGAMFVSTSQDFSIMEGDNDYSGGPLATDYLNASTLEVARVLDSANVTGPDTSYNEAENLIAAPDGPAISIVTGIGVKNGPVLANGPYGPGNACIFQGAAFG